MQVVAAPWGRSAVCSWAEPCSLAGAQEAVRRIDGNMHADIDVLLEGGTYDLTGPLSFGPQDSGTNGYTVTYGAAPGAHPVLSGAVAVTGWHEVDETSDIWAAPVAPGFDTTQLYVDGRQVPRSSGLPSATYIQSTTGFTTTSPVLANWTNVSNVSAVFEGGNGAWTQTSCPVASVDGNTITMAEPCWDNLHLPADGSQEVAWADGPQGGFGGLSGAAQPSYFENAVELLTPGTWAIDTVAHEMYYEPAAGQNVATATVLAPALQSLVTVQGSLGNPVRDLTLSGLQFAYTTWTQPDTDQGFAEMQADWTLTGSRASSSQGTCTYSTPAGTCPYASWTRTPGAVLLSATHGVTLSGDTFTALGGAGLDVEYGSQDDHIVGNVFDDIAANAIQLGSTDDPLPSEVGAGSDETDADDTVADNYIYDVANQWLGGVGIWVGYVQGARIVHNQVDDVPYTAISIGWAGWHSDALSPDSDPNVNADNVIADNLLYDYMQQLGDGGAIYTNGGQATDWSGELMISGNVNYGGTNTDFSYYTDTGSKYVELSGNVEYDEPVDSFASGGCHTVGHIRLDGNWFAQAGPLYPCAPAVDVVASGDTAVCDTLPPGQVPDAVLAAAGLEPAYRSLLDAAAPSVASVGPATLPLAGGAVLIGGSGFTPSTTVTFGGAPATSVSVLSGNYLIAAAPAGSSGTAAVAVTTAAGSSAAASVASVSYSSTPSPCVPYLGGNFSTALAPAGPSLPSGSPSPSPPSPSSPPPSLPSPSSLPTPWLPVVPSPPL